MSCLEACRSRGYDDAIEYGISVKYARTRQWGEWEVFREFMQNALDEEHYVRGEVPKEYLCRGEPNKTIIYDHGRGISLDKLLVGESSKEKWQRGMFGEGMKLAMIGALLLGYIVRIRSRDKEVVPITIEKSYEGTPVQILCACIKKGLPMTEGTQVIIEGTNLCTKYERYVVQGIRQSVPEAAVYHMENTAEKRWYDVLLQTASPHGESAIYVRDLYVSDVRTIFPGTIGALYSYNLYNITLDESRKIPSSGSVYSDLMDLIRYIAEHAVVVEAAKSILEHIISRSIELCRDKWERSVTGKVNLEATVGFAYYGMSDSARKLIAEIFDRLYGADAVIVTEFGKYEAARYLGLKPILCGEAIGEHMSRIIKSELRIIERQRGFLHKIVDIEKQMPQYKNLIDILLDMAKYILPSYVDVSNIKFAILDPDKAGQTTIDKIILVNLLHLLSECQRSTYACVSHWFSVIIHECAHAMCVTMYGKMCDDTTPEFIYSITDMAGRATLEVMTKPNRYKMLLEDLQNERKKLGW
jgi:hypothetical protein